MSTPTVICLYRVAAGREAEFEALLERHWPTLRSLDLVTGTPPRHYRGVEQDGRPLLVEVFEWKSDGASQLAHEHPEVMAIWTAMGEMTEPRDGRPGMEFPHVEPLAIPGASSAAPAVPRGRPPGFLLYQMAVGHYVSRALGLAAKLGLADALARGPREARALADATGTDAHALARVMRLLASVGVFEEPERGRFALTPLGDLLREDAPGSMRAMVMLFGGESLHDSWKELEYCVRTGQPAYRKADPDGDPFVQMARDPEAAALFDKAMATFAPQTAAAVAAAYDFSGFGKLVDVGGGNGALLLGILQANPGLAGVVFDQPHVAERARAHVAASGLADRCEVVGGSFFEAVPAGADAYLLKHVIHDWNDERAAAILATVRAAMPSKARLLIVEGVYPARIEPSLECRGAAANDVNMLVCTGGRQRSEAEFRELLAAAGFSLTRVVPTPSPVCVIEGACA